MIDMTSINEKIKYIREWLNLTNKDVSQFLNASAYLYASYEKENYDIPFQKLCLIANLFSVNVIDLIDVSVSLKDIENRLISNEMISISKEKLLDKMKINLNISKNKNYKQINKLEVIFIDITIDILKKIVCVYGKNDIAKKINISLYELDLIIQGKRNISSKEVQHIIEEFRAQMIKQGE